jgi:hypothetical protein
MHLHQLFGSPFDAGPTIHQVIFLVALAIPVAGMTWVLRVLLTKRSKDAVIPQAVGALLPVLAATAAVTLLISEFHLFYQGWRGYVLGEFGLIFIAMIYIRLVAKLR